MSRELGRYQPCSKSSVYVKKLSGVIHRSNRGNQHLSIIYSNRLSEKGFEPSCGSTVNFVDNVMAESVIGLYKTEMVHATERGRPSKEWGVLP